MMPGQISQLFYVSIGIIVVFLFPQYVVADIYSYRDDKGVLHLSNDPRDERKGELIIREDVSQLAYNKNTHQIISMIEKVAIEKNVDPCLAKAIARAESGFNPDAVSPKGAIGIMQLMPDTAKRFKVDDIYNPEQNINGGIKYLKFLLDLFPGNLRKVIAAYNAGENRVKRDNGVPNISETKVFVDRVIVYYNNYKTKRNLGRPVKRIFDKQGNIYLTNMF